ncbi:sulfur carrier protein ThiS [Nocardioides solisilvae]|uniref:sulfur carrier protein ThiS n=1 Tax=Nocardioides solisilvae TaxID=1542435 RepID=UPI0013A547F7|nr:sulfur carrier protein ThiS [Nocardioides solisilvae]
MRITFDGREVEVPDGDLAALLRHRDAPTTGCAVAVNGRVVPRAAHAGHPLRPGDVVDVVQAVPGG